MLMKHDDASRPDNAPAGEQYSSETPAMQAIKSVCVYCGSSNRVDERYKKHAAELGQMLAHEGMQVVYGGGRVGLMGIVADAAMNAGGKVVGIIPQHIQAMEVEHHGLTELHVVDSMHTRKRMMADRSDAFIVLPGGFGTMDEAFEIITWRRLGLHNKPVIIVDDNGFWQPLIKLLDHLIETGFAIPRDRQLYKVVTSLEDAMRILRQSKDAGETKSELM
jgi:uncharacterized protein (TIGR00730 family)